MRSVKSGSTLSVSEALAVGALLAVATIAVLYAVSWASGNYQFVFYGPAITNALTVPVALIALVVGRGATRIYAAGLLAAAGVLTVGGVLINASLVHTS